MKREVFFRELEFLLSDLAEEEREEALEFYRDYLDEAGPEGEQEVLEHLGSPEKVAAQIRTGLMEHGEEGEISERGFRDERFEEDNQVPDQYTEIVKADRKENDSESETGDEFYREKKGGERTGQERNQTVEDLRRFAGECRDRAQEYLKDKGGLKGAAEDMKGKARDFWRENEGFQSTAEEVKEKAGQFKEKAQEYWKESREYGRSHWEGTEGRTEGRENRQQSGQQEECTALKRRRRNTGNVILLAVLLVVFGIPLMGRLIASGFSVVFGIIGAIFGVFAGLIGLAVGLIGTTVGLLTGGISLIVRGIIHMSMPPQGAMFLCLGFLSLAAAMVMIIAARWAVGTVIPGVFRFCLGMARTLLDCFFSLLRGLIDRIRGKGGAQE